MPLIIFWLTPVILVVIFLLIVIQNKAVKKPKMFLVEPLLFLVDKWEIARIEGDKKNTEKLLGYWLPGLEMQHSPAEQIVRQIRSNPPIVPNKKIIVLNQKKLSFWAEEREIELNGKTTSVLVGSVSEVLEYCDADSVGRLKKEKKESLLKTAQKAYGNGFWVLAIAQASSEKAISAKKYRLEGLVILEPNINDKARGKLHYMNAQGPVKFLSYLPGNFVSNLVEKVFPNHNINVISGNELKELDPKEQDKAVKERNIFSETAKNNRYYIAKHISIDNDLIILSRISSDEELPAKNKI